MDLVSRHPTVQQEDVLTSLGVPAPLPLLTGAPSLQAAPSTRLLLFQYLLALSPAGPANAFGKSPFMKLPSTFQLLRAICFLLNQN